MATAEQRFEADTKFVYRALQDARQYVTDFDREGSKAKALYVRLDKARSLMQPWSTDGTAVQAKKAIEYLRELGSLASDKIGPASRREFREQGGARNHATKKKSPAQLQREINEALRLRVTKLDPKQVERDISQGLQQRYDEAVRPEALTPAQRSFVEAVEEDVRLFPAAYKAAYRSNPAEWALKGIEGLDDADMRQMAREQRAETKRSLQLIGRKAHATRKSATKTK